MRNRSTTPIICVSGNVQHQTRERGFDCRRGDIDGDIAAGLDMRQQQRGLLAIARAEIDPLASAAHDARNVFTVSAQDAALRARRVVLGKPQIASNSWQPRAS